MVPISISLSFFSFPLLKVLTFRWMTWQIKLYSSWQQPQGFFCSQRHKFQAGVTMIDGLMTELCKSFNPFIKLNRGALDALYPSTSPHLASVKDTQCCQMLDRSWWHAALRAFMRHGFSWWKFTQCTVLMKHIDRMRHLILTLFLNTPEFVTWTRIKKVKKILYNSD